jgi:hypothetical protein
LKLRFRGQSAPRFVEQELRAYLRCGVLAHGFLRLHCDACKLDRLGRAAPAVFEVDALRCPGCGARMRLLAAIEDPEVARKILECLDLPARPPARIRATRLKSPSAGAFPQHGAVLSLFKPT